MRRTLFSVAIVIFTLSLPPSPLASSLPPSPLASSSHPVEDPCSPVGMDETLTLADQILTLRGTGNFDSCRTALQPVLRGNASTDCNDRTCKITHSFKKPPVKYKNLEFFGTSEFFYTMRDTLRISGQYRASSFNRTARVSDHAQTDADYDHCSLRSTARQTGVCWRNAMGRSSTPMPIYTGSSQ